MSNKDRTVRSITPPPAFRVFVSSTYTDMLPYREAIQSALNKADCVPYGMERFGAQALPPIEVCYSELESSQIYICALGMRYGSIDEKSQRSFTQLEYEKARELGLPTLVFLIDEERVSFKMSEIDMGEGGQKLKAFKDEIKNSKEVTCDFFSSPMALQDAVYRSIMTEKKRQGQVVDSNTADKEYIQGAKKFRQFVRRPRRYNGTSMLLRVRMDGLFGGWRLREELYDAFKMIPGDALFLNDLWVLGCDSVDVDPKVWRMDCFAQGDAADWLDQNDVTTGTVFEGRFIVAYEEVSQVASRGGAEVDAKIANLILIEGIRVIERDQVRPLDFSKMEKDEDEAILSRLADLFKA